MLCLCVLCVVLVRFFLIALCVCVRNVIVRVAMRSKNMLSLLQQKRHTSITAYSGGVLEVFARKLRTDSDGQFEGPAF